MGAIDADPFDVFTGIYYREYPDLYVADSMPLNFVRTQRNLDPRVRAFGVGASTSYDMFIVGDTEKFSWVALVDANGSQRKYIRVTPGTGYSDGVFKDTSSPTEFLGSIIFWDHGAWTVRLLNGVEYTIRGCSETSKPGQCAVTEIRNPNGKKVTIQRDFRGNIHRITSPHQHYISVTTDTDGKITRAEDDAGHWVSYEYDPAGWLKKATTWRGETDEFKYDTNFNMIWVGEKDRKTAAGKYRFTVMNRFDEKNRFKWQKVGFGNSVQIFSATYKEDAEGKIRQTNVHSNDGMSNYFFNAAGYATREDFTPLNGAKWSLEYTRHPETNATTDTWLSCRASRIHVSASISAKLEAMGEGHQLVVSKECESLEARSAQQP